MNNNINNLRFNTVNFGSKGEKTEAEENISCCDCPECKGTEASADMALDAIGRAQVKGPYVFNPENVKNDVKEFQEAFFNAETEYEITELASDYYAELIGNGVEPTVAQEKAQLFGQIMLQYNNR